MRFHQYIVVYADGSSDSIVTNTTNSSSVEREARRRMPGFHIIGVWRVVVHHNTPRLVPM